MEMEPSYWTIPKDKLDLHFAPYFRKWDDNSRKFTLRLSKGFYMHENSPFLDPFKRFSYVYYDVAADYIADNWDNPDMVGGYIMEALVGCHLEHEKNCFNCESAKSLRWNGGPSSASAWADVVCVACGATYEIKSKHNQDKVLDSLMKHDTVAGGSFIAFSKYKRPGKQYLVMVPRIPEANGFHPVSIALIDQVIPSLTNYSFDMKKLDNMRISSQIKVNARTRQTWCVVPACPLSYFHTVAQAYDEVFGDGEWGKKHPDHVAWNKRGRMFADKNDDSLLAGFRGLSINSSSPPWKKSSSAAVHKTPRKVDTPRFTTIGPSYSRNVVSKRNEHADRYHQVEEDYHNANFNTRKNRKSRW